MGCWEETCALTHLPIRGGDKIVLCLWKTKSIRKADFRNAGLIDVDTSCLVDVITGIYDSYGGVESPWFLPTYDIGLKEESLYPVFFHEAAWTMAGNLQGVDAKDFYHSALQRIRFELSLDALARFDPKTDSPPSELYDPHPLGRIINDGSLRDLVKICGVMNSARRPMFFGHLFRGMQTVRYPLHRSVLEITEFLLKPVEFEDTFESE